MMSVRFLVQKTATAYVPEAEVAGNIENAFGQVKLDMRTYGLTADSSYLDSARKAVNDVHTQQKAAQNLADEHPELIELYVKLKALEPALIEYESLIAQTETKCKEIAGSYEKLNKLASDFIAKADQLTAIQRLNLEKEIKASAGAEKIQECLQKVMLVRELRGDGNAARIVAYKSQALRDPKAMEDGIKSFETMDKKFDELLALLKVQADMAELNQVKTDAHAYRDAMKQVMTANYDLAEVGKKRREAMLRVDFMVDEMQATGI